MTIPEPSDPPEPIEPELEELLSRFIKNQELMAFKFGVDKIIVGTGIVEGIKLEEDEVLMIKDGIPYIYQMGKS